MFIYCRFYNSKLNFLVFWKMNLNKYIVEMLGEISWNYWSNIDLR